MLKGRGDEDGRLRKRLTEERFGRSRLSKRLSRLACVEGYSKRPGATSKVQQGLLSKLSAARVLAPHNAWVMCYYCRWIATVKCLRNQNLPQNRDGMPSGELGA